MFGCANVGGCTNVGRVLKSSCRTEKRLQLNRTRTFEDRTVVAVAADSRHFGFQLPHVDKKHKTSTRPVATSLHRTGYHIIVKSKHDIHKAIVVVQRHNENEALATT